jgi:hypothetical protein
MGKPTQVWMPQANMQKISAIQDVHSVSPQVCEFPAAQPAAPVSEMSS